MVTVRSVEVLDGYRLRLSFSDEVQGIVEIDPRGKGPMFDPLVKEAYFRQVRVSRAAGTVVWPNGLALAPEALRERALRAKPTA